MQIKELDDKITETILGCERVASGSIFSNEESVDFLNDRLRQVRNVQLELISMLYGLHGIVTNCDQR